MNRPLHYDPETGLFTYLSGKLAGHLNNHGYILLAYDSRQILAHRVAWKVYYGAWPTGEIDHINGIRHDNRICNLRVVTKAENKQNHCRLGVSFRKDTNKWRAYININKRRTYLGQFDSFEEAKKAYLNSKFVLHKYSDRVKEHYHKH